MIFSKQEMQRRLQSFTQTLQEREVDAAFLHTADHSYYFSGVPLLSEWGRPMWSVICANGAAALIGADMEKENMENYSFFPDILTFNDLTDVRDAAIRLVCSFIAAHQHGVRRLGVELELLPVGLYRAISDAFPGVALVDISDVIQELRSIKSPEEIALLRLGGEVAKIGAKAFIDACHAYTTEIHIASHAVHEMNKAVAALYPQYVGGAVSTYSYCQLGLHTLTPHLHPTNRILKQGDVVALNVFPVIWGYAMMLERTFIFGEPTDAQYHALQTATSASKLGREAMRPGVEPAEVHALCHAFLREKGYDGAYIRHGTGHSQGIMIGAAARESLGDVRPYNHRPYCPNQITSSGPGIYIPGLGGFRQNDVMLIEEDGAVCLSEFTRDIGKCLAEE